MERNNQNGLSLQGNGATLSLQAILMCSRGVHRHPHLFSEVMGSLPTVKEKRVLKQCPWDTILKNGAFLTKRALLYNRKYSRAGNFREFPRIHEILSCREIAYGPK